jgi:hypothetical protein
VGMEGLTPWRRRKGAVMIRGRVVSGHSNL